LRNAGYIQNDVYTLRNNFLTGHEGAEKKLHRARPPELTLEGALERIEQTFREAQKEVRAHPKNPALQPVRVSPLLPDVEQAHRSFLVVEFDEKPTTTPVPVVLLPEPGGPESKPAYVAYKGADAGEQLPAAYKTLKTGEEGVELTKQEIYVWENRWASEVQRRRDTTIAELFLARPRTSVDPTGRRETLYMPGAPIQRMRKQLAAAIVHTVSAADKLVLEARPPTDEEREQEARVSGQLHGEVAEDDSDEEFDADLKEVERLLELRD
jgi:hypothetical protein